MSNEQQPIFYYKPPVTGSLKFMHASWMKDDYKRDGWLPLYSAPPLRDSEVMEECAKLCENIYSWSGAYSAGALCTHTLDAAAAAIREKAKDQSRPLYSAPPLRDLSNKQRLYLAQAWTMLEEYAELQKANGNDSIAQGALASAHEIKLMLSRGFGGIENNIIAKAREKV